MEPRPSLTRSNADRLTAKVNETVTSRETVLKTLEGSKLPYSVYRVPLNMAKTPETLIRWCTDGMSVEPKILLSPQIRPDVQKQTEGEVLACLKSYLIGEAKSRGLVVKQDQLLRLFSELFPSADAKIVAPYLTFY